MDTGNARGKVITLFLLTTSKGGSSNMLGLGVERTWMKGLFQSYYHSHPVNPPYDVSRREFGHGSFKKIDTRHLSFDTTAEFNAFLQNVSPLYISASASQFLNPSAQPISSKGLIGSDLIYEFDADDIPSPCKEIHDSWKCVQCAAVGKGHVKKCPYCGHGTQLDEWVCSSCLSSTKEQTFSLLNVLQDDFGFTSNDLRINFSGSKGYHVHVSSPSIFSLPKSARIELMDYLSLHEWDVASAGFFFDGKQFHCPKMNHAVGLASRLLNEIRNKLEFGSIEEWAVLSGTIPRVLKPFLLDRERLLRDVSAGVLPPLPGKKTESFWGNVLSSLSLRIKLNIDRQTSGDIYKLLRVPDTLHGSTGFVSKSLSLETLSPFDPFVDAVAFSRSIKRKVFVKTSPMIRIGDETLDPLSEKEVLVSESMAAYLVGWGAATLR
ncbi:MAG: DNA primase small subunit domain-containing protein [Candidatus Diapherotrites archaeon]